jgi:uncharacterized protein DUF5317
MVLPLIVIVAAAIAGFLAGGRLKAFEHLKLRWWALAPIGLAMQVTALPGALGGGRDEVEAVVLVASFPVLLVFVARNIGLPGFAMLFVGLALNFAVIAPNAGMPVSVEAVRAAGGAEAVRELVESQDGKHHVLTDEDVLVPLADVIAVAEPVGQVFSVGDVTIYLALVWFVVGAMRAPIPATGLPEHPRPRGYRGKHRVYRTPPPGAPLQLPHAAVARSGTAR